MLENYLKPSSKPSSSQDSLSKYSCPFPLEENKNSESTPIHIDQVLPLEENPQSLIQRLQEAQTKSFQNRKNLLNELTKEKKNFEKNSEISLKQDDLVQFFTNNGELRTLNEENLEEIEKDTKIIDKKYQEISSKKDFYEPCEEIGNEGTITPPPHFLLKF